MRPLPVALTLCALALAGAGESVPLRINTTASAPLGFYFRSSDAATRGDFVEVCLPSEAARLARDRTYVGPGSCPDGNEPLVKTLAARAGDTVELAAAGVRVAGVLLAGSEPLTRDRRGRSLPALGPQTLVLQAGEVWLHGASSPWSFDSRYFGPVPSAAVRARLVPLLVFSTRAP